MFATVHVAYLLLLIRMKEKRLLRVMKHRTRVDYAHFMKELVQQYPDAESIRLVQDNLNTHTAASFYNAFAPEEAFDLAKMFEYYYTPKKGSWLNMAEIELSALSKQCLDRRIGDIDTLTKEDVDVGART